MIPQPRSRIIAVVGGSGAGKSWLVTQLCRIIGDDAGRLALAHPYSKTRIAELADHLCSLLAEVGALPCWMRETFHAELLSLLAEHEYAN